jgi:hypothetical protein
VWHQLSNGKAELTAGYLPLGSDHQCDALLPLAAFAALPQVDQIDEPRGLEPLWWRLAGLTEVAPKRWLDADQAALASSGSLRQINLDRDVQQCLNAVLVLKLLAAAKAGADLGWDRPAQLGRTKLRTSTPVVQTLLLSGISWRPASQLAGGGWRPIASSL